MYKKILFCFLLHISLLLSAQSGMPDKIKAIAVDTPKTGIVAPKSAVNSHDTLSAAKIAGSDSSTMGETNKASTLNDNPPVEMADVLRQSGKIYTVVISIMLIFAGIIAFLIYLERKLKQLEENDKIQKK